MSCRSILGLFVLTAVLLNAGCGDNTAVNAVAAANDSNVKRLSNLFQSYASRNGWRGPKDEAQFREFIHDFPAHRLQMLGVDPDQLDELFTSERDGQPFQIKYETSSGLEAVVPVVFEQQGVEGTRAVGFTDGSVQLVDENKYRQLSERAPTSRGQQ